VLALSDKLETRAPYRIADIGAIDHLIVEHDAPAALLDKFAQAGATLLAAPAP
jgi:DeoR/GlpR family transcriptional regulator of sugar metabolism